MSTLSADWHRQMRDEREAARCEQEHHACRIGCTCARHYQPGDAK